MSAPLQDAAWLAERLGIPRLRAYELLRTDPKGLGVVRIGRSVKCRPEVVEQWIEAGGTNGNGHQ